MTKKIFEKLPKCKQDSKILLLTHTDMDGSGPVVILKTVFGKNNVSVKHCPNSSMSSEITAAVLDDETMKQYDMIIICDISCSEEDAYKINISGNADKLVLLDHHVTALGLNQFSWACVCPDIIDDSYRCKYYPSDTTGHSSGTSLLYDYLDYCEVLKGVPNIEFLKTFVHTITIYDTWDWVYIFDRTESAKTLSCLFDIYGAEYFEDKYIGKCMNPYLRRNDHMGLFDETDELFLSIENKKNIEYNKRKETQFVNSKVNIAGRDYNMVYCFADQYLDDIFDRMNEMYPQADIYCINRGNSLSLRTRKDGVNVSGIAKLYGGGGHVQSAGIPITAKIQKEYFESILHSKIQVIA